MTELKTVHGGLLKTQRFLTYNQETKFLTFFPIAPKWLKKKKKFLGSTNLPKVYSFTHLCSRLI